MLENLKYFTHSVGLEIMRFMMYLKETYMGLLIVMEKSNIILQNCAETKTTLWRCNGNSCFVRKRPSSFYRLAEAVESRAKCR